MIVLDASLLIAHLNPADAHHAAATRILLDASDESLLVHSLTLAEVLVGGARVGQGTQMLADLRAIDVQVAIHDEDQPLRLAELRASTGLKLPDCCVLDTAVANDAKLVTFDRALGAAAQRHRVTVLGQA